MFIVYIFKYCVYFIAFLCASNVKKVLVYFTNTPKIKTKRTKNSNCMIAVLVATVLFLKRK